VAQPVGSVRRTQGLTRGLLSTAVGLVAGIGLLQFVLSEHTDRYFAWTIKVPATAAFLGALYLGSGIGEAFAARTPTWAYARIAVPSVTVFAGLTTAVTFAHLELFHFGGSYPISGQAIAWIWLAVYLGFPTVSVIVLVRQARLQGLDPPRRQRLPAWFRLLLTAQGILMLSAGLLLLLAPGTVSTGWPWPLTNLTAQAIGAWGIGLGIGNLHAAAADDWPRIWVGMPALLGIGVLQLTVLARYAGAVQWHHPSAWILLSLVASLVLAGGYGTVQGRSHWISASAPDGLPTPGSADAA
jgi:hypothetical protein